MTDWEAEVEDLLERFIEGLRAVSGDGSKKRQAGTKPPWYEDDDHERGLFSHITKWKAGELVDSDSGRHPLWHTAWRAAAIACREEGNVPKPEPKRRCLIHPDGCEDVVEDIQGGLA